MNIKSMLIFIVILFAILCCEKEENNEETKKEDPTEIKEVNDTVAIEIPDTLFVSEESIEFTEEGGLAVFELQTNAEEWNITFPFEVDWIQLSQDLGTAGTTIVEISALRNPTTNKRETKLEIEAGDSLYQEINIIQAAALYPGYNTHPHEPDSIGMLSSAEEIANKIILGWNCGNTLEAIGGETSWGNPKITEDLIQLVKQSGFNAIRLPCSWDQYTDQNTAEIDESWLNRVKEVVQLCVDQDMYVLLNIHWDGGWLENNCTPEKQKENNAKQRALWEQIASGLRDFDEHLLFAGANEPNVDNPSQMEVLLSYHQTFIDAVRSTGGKNAYRVLVIQGPSTDIEKTNNLMSSLPSDKRSDKMMVEIHYYTPYQFTLMTEDASWGKVFYYWGAEFHSETDPERNANWGEESTVDALMELMHTKFVTKSIPVILGEYATGRRLSLSGADLDLHLESRAYWLKYVTKQAKANGILPFYWDNGGLGDNGFGLFDRTNNTIYDQQAIDGLVSGAK